MMKRDATWLKVKPSGLTYRKISEVKASDRLPGKTQTIKQSKINNYKTPLRYESHISGQTVISSNLTNLSPYQAQMNAI